MKVNLKKIGAIVAGATILASTAAFGALWYGNTKLVDENGAPVAKVVVGEKAAASDGVGAALIASRMMASAYKTVELKGQVVGTATCTGGEGSGSGTCPISDEKVTLEISVPGAVAEGTYT
ncbi:MAG: S-layer protein, partial [Candidatus Bilamarchaeaceae archaeon]